MRTPLMMLVALSLCAAAPTPAQAEAALTPDQFTAIDGALTAFIPLDGDSPSAADLEAARAACRAGDSADPLLGPFRQACSASVRTAAAAISDCGGRTACARAMRRTRVEATTLVAKVRAFNAALSAASLPAGCEKSMRTTKAQLRLLERQRNFFGLLERAIKTGSKRLLRRADREAAAIARLEAKEPSATTERNRFRAACAPAPA